MAVLLIAETLAGELATDATAKALSAAKQLGDVTVLVAGENAKGPAEAAAKLAVEVHKTPNLAFWREGRVLGCLPRVRDWSDYMAAIPRLLAD